MIKAALRGHGLTFEQVRGVFVSHFHPDHAGTLELLRRHGVIPWILERQAPHIAWLNEFFTQKKNDPHGDYAPLDVDIVLPITPDEARRHLADCSIEGKILYTPGHSDDSITLIAGNAAFVGDMPPYEWHSIADCGVRRIYPAHGAATKI